MCGGAGDATHTGYSDTLRLALALLWLWTSLLLGLSSTFPLAKRTAVFAMGIVPLFASHLQTMSPNAPFVLYGTCIVNALLACVVT